MYTLVIPNKLRPQALSFAHERESGHLGFLKSALKAEDYFYWPNLRADMRKHIKECITCQQLKTARSLQMQRQELPPCHKPLERISMDITDMHTSNSGHRYILTLIDHYSRYAKFIKMRSRLAEEIVKGVQTYVGDFGAQKVLLTDNAREFHANVVKNLCTKMGIQLVFSTPYHPQGSSISERMHRTM